MGRNLAGIEAFAELLEASNELVGETLSQALSGRFVDEDGVQIA